MEAASSVTNFFRKTAHAIVDNVKGEDSTANELNLIEPMEVARQLSDDSLAREKEHALECRERTELGDLGQFDVISTVSL